MNFTDFSKYLVSAYFLLFFFVVPLFLSLYCIIFLIFCKRKVYFFQVAYPLENTVCKHISGCQSVSRQIGTSSLVYANSIESDGCCMLAVLLHRRCVT